MAKFELQYSLVDGDAIHIISDTNMDKFFYVVSRIITFQDCNDVDFYGITMNDKPIHYIGWQPDCVFTYEDEDDNVVYENHYPQFDH